MGRANFIYRFWKVFRVARDGLGPACFVPDAASAKASAGGFG